MSHDQERVLKAEAALPDSTRQGVLRRLRRLEGQVRGVQRMVEEGRDCQEMLHQIAAVEAAARSLGGGGAGALCAELPARAAGQPFPGRGPGAGASGRAAAVVME